MEDFGYKKSTKPENNSNLAKKFFFISATLLSLSAFVYISLKSYHFINGVRNKGEVIVIKGPATPIKIYENNENNPAQENPEIAANNSIYDEILNNDEKAQENIKVTQNQEPAFPPPENLHDMIDKNKATDILQKKLSNNNIQEIIVNPKDKKPQIVKKDQLPKNIVNSQQNINEVSDKKSFNPPVLKPDNNSANPSKPQLNSSDNKKIANEEKNSAGKKRLAIRVQISAMSSIQNCEDYYRRLSKTYPTLFLKTKYYIKEANLGSRGMFYRLQIGDFFNQIDAEEFCKKFITQSQKPSSECIIVE